MANIFRMQEEIEHLRGISDPSDGGITRIGFTEKYRLGVEYIAKRMREIGLTVREDQVGNIYGVLPGSNPDLPSIISGSHLDTVRNAGAYDGIAGVVCAIEAVRMLKERNIQLKHTLEVLATIEEEGTYFGNVLVGSKFICGELTERDYDSLRNEAGQSMRDILETYIGKRETIRALRDPSSVKAFIEVHDEQGPVLDSTATDIGIVDTIVAIGQIQVTIQGVAGHAGTVPMNLRQDAGVAGCLFASRMTEYVLRKYVGTATLTIGKFSLLPNSANCIPSQCSFTLDIRSGLEPIVLDIMDYAKDISLVIERECSVKNTVTQVSLKSPVSMDKNLCKVIEHSCIELGMSYKHLNSGAGHDSMIMAGICPTAMIFIPCLKGITHHPDEYVSGNNMADGADVLLKTIIQLDLLETMPD